MRRQRHAKPDCGCDRNGWALPAIGLTLLPPGILRALPPSRISYSPAMFRLLRSLCPRCTSETSRLIVGSTGSGKSEGGLVDLVGRLATFHSDVVHL